MNSHNAISEMNKTASTWQTVVVINPEYYDEDGALASPIDFGGGIQLGALPDWVRSVGITKDMSCYQRERVIKDGKLAFTAKYEAESLGDPDPTWRGEEPRGKQEIALERILLGSLAVWLAKPSWVGGRLLIHAREEKDEWILRESSSLEPIRPHGRDATNHLRVQDYREAVEFYKALISLDRTGTPWVAARTLLNGLSAREWDIRFLLLWISLEALFGASSEVSYRIAQRIAFFNTESRAEAKRIFNKARRGYDWRSKIVHGLQLRKLNREESEEVLYETEMMVRTSLQKVLVGKGMLDNFSDKNREVYLDSLVFSANDSNDKEIRTHPK